MSRFKPFAHLEYMNDLRSRLPKPLRYNLSDSCAETLSVKALMSYDKSQQLDNLSLSYASISGSEPLRQQIARYHGGNAEQVVTFCGAQEALFALFNDLIEPGDEVINLSPAYPSILALPEQLGAKVKSIALSMENDWQFTLDEVKARISPATKIIVLNSPHNPTGAVMPMALANDLLALAQAHGIYIISDEVSLRSNYNNLDLDYPFLRYERGVVVGVMSKSLGLAGVRIGWAITQDKALRQGLMDMRGYTSICGSTTDEYLATIALAHAEQLLERNNAIIKTNIALFEQFIAQSNGEFEWVKPQAGILTLVKVNRAQDVMALAKHMAFEQQLLLLPGKLFGIEGNYFRLGLGREHFAQALAAFKAGL